MYNILQSICICEFLSRCDVIYPGNFTGYILVCYIIYVCARFATSSLSYMYCKWMSLRS